MNDSATVKIFLVQGNPTSLRTAEISNWTGKAVAGPRKQIEEILNREEASKAGIYFLNGIDPDSGKPSVYIGEAECIQKRIKQHLSKDYWKSIVFFVSKDENLTKAHIKYLEGKLIALAEKIGRNCIVNNQSSGSKLPESDEADMNIFLSRMQQLLPILGQEFLKPVIQEQGQSESSELLFCDIKGVKAKGRITDNGFVILKGSEAVLKERPSTKKYKYAANLREEIIKDNAVKEDGNKLIFLRDCEFSSPSAAAAVIHGGQANGLTSWKDKKGVSLKDKEAREITSS